MNKIKYKGIPYLGENNQEKFEYIVNNTVYQDYLCDFITFFDNIFKPKNYVVIIDNFITWLDDIQFNYRDAMITVPYFIYDYYNLEKVIHSKSRCFIDENGNSIIRYNYELHKLKFTDTVQLKVYSIKDNKFFNLKLTFPDDKNFVMSDLYERYRNSCYFDSIQLNKEREAGYFYFTKEFVGFTNIENRYRQKLYLDTFKDNVSVDEEDYRDVRDYTNNRVGIFYDEYDLNETLYKYRRLSFDMLLYNVVHNNMIAIDDELYNKYLNSSKQQYYKYKKDFTLIFKKYWLKKQGTSIIEKRFCDV